MSSSKSGSPEKSQIEEWGEEVNPRVVEDVVEALLGLLDRKGVARSWEAALLHRVVKENVVYDEEISPNFERGPVECWRKGGKCVDQSILFGSMLKAAGIPGRLRLTKKNIVDGHMYVEVYFPESNPEVVKESLKEFYSAKTDVDSVSISYTDDDELEGYWFMADPEGSEYIGDISGFLASSYMWRNEDGPIRIYVHDTYNL